MTNIEIQHVDGLNGTPAARLSVMGWLDVDERGLGEPGGVLNMGWNFKAFIAIAQNGQEKIPVGVLTYDFLKVTKTLFLLQAYTIPEFRGRGVYTALFAAAVEKAAEIKAPRIMLGTHPRNAAMREIAAKHGGRETCITVTFEVG